MHTISKKTRWVSVNAWRGYSEPVYWVAGANDTGEWSDSPCPSNLATAELALVKRALRVAGIKYREMTTESSNVFCMHRYIVVAAADLEKAKALLSSAYATAWRDDTRLLYVNND